MSGEVAPPRPRGRPPKPRPPLPTEATAFLDSMLAERGAARATLAAYAQDLATLTGWLAARHTTLLTAERSHLLAFLEEGAAAGLAPRTLQRRRAAIRQLYGFLLSENRRSDDPSARLAAPRPGRDLPRVLAESEAAALVEGHRAALPLDPGLPDEARLALMIELAYGAGLRTSELMGLKLAAIERQAGLIRVRGKGGRERIVPLTATVEAALDAWAPHRAAQLGGKPARSPYLFPSPDAEGGHLTRQRLDQLLRARAAAIGLPPGALSAHTLRHAFATHLVEGGAHLRIVQALLGHADIATTEIYAHVAADRLRQTVERAHPLAQNQAQARDQIGHSADKPGGKAKPV